MIDRRSLVLGSLFLAGGGVRLAASAVAKPAPASPRTLAKDLPDVIANRSASVADAPMLPQRDATTDLIYDDFVARSYRGPGVPPITLLIAYGSNQGGGLEVHRPENCYPPFGFTLRDSRTARLTLSNGAAIDVTTVTAIRNGIADQLLFWTRVGNTFPTSQWQTDIGLARAALRGEAPDGALVRLSVTTGNINEGNMILARFARDLVDAVPLRTRLLMVGGAGRLDAKRKLA